MAQLSPEALDYHRHCQWKMKATVECQIPLNRIRDTPGYGDAVREFAVDRWSRNEAVYFKNQRVEDLDALNILLA